MISWREIIHGIGTGILIILILPWLGVLVHYYYRWVFSF